MHSLFHAILDQTRNYLFGKRTAKQTQLLSPSTTEVTMGCKSSICTMSLGRCFAGHDLEHKLDVAAKHGFGGIELFYEDLVDMAARLPGGDSPENQLLAASKFRRLCFARGLDIICLQPFMHYGGQVDRRAHQEQLETLKFWIELVHALGTDLIVFPSSFLPSEQLSRDTGLLIDDFVDAAELGLRAEPPVRFAYEALCWGTTVDTWEKSWEVVRGVDRPNFGICLDSFNIAGRVYADPAASSGCNSNGETALRLSLETLVSQVEPSKIFLVQVADAEKMTSPINAGHAFYSPEQPARMSWSRNARLFYGEEQFGSYLPARQVLSTIINDLGYQGWLSFEVFNRRLADKDSVVPLEMGRRAERSWRIMMKDLGLGESVKPVSAAAWVQPML